MVGETGSTRHSPRTPRHYSARSEIACSQALLSRNTHAEGHRSEFERARNGEMPSYPGHATCSVSFHWKNSIELRYRPSCPLPPSTVIEGESCHPLTCFSAVFHASADQQWCSVNSLRRRHNLYAMICGRELYSRCCCRCCHSGPRMASMAITFARLERMGYIDSIT